MTTTEPTPIDFRTVPPKLTATAAGWQAWWEDHDLWDGHALYADLDAAKHHAAVDYIGEEHGWLPGDDPADEAPNVTLTWTFEHQRWHLLADGKNTGVQLVETSLYTPDTTPAADPDIPEALVAYLQQRDIQRAQDVAALASTFTERELLLMKEAAVMGYVQGVRHGPYRDRIPGDRAVLLEVLDACLSFRDLYPTITGYQPEPEDAS